MSPTLVERAWRWHQWRPPLLPGRVVTAIRRSFLKRTAGEVICELKTGQKFAAQTADLIQCTVAVNGEWEGLIFEAVRSLVPAGGTVIDVGGHVGYASLMFADWVGDEGVVYCFEPVPENAMRVRRNLELNSLENRVRIYEYAVSDRNGRAQFFYDSMQNTGVGSLTPHEGQRLKLNVETIVLNEWRNSLGVEHVDLIKIDVEGAEAAVLEGMRPGLAAGCYRHILLEVHPPDLLQAGSSLEKVLDLIRGYGYSLQYWNYERDVFDPEPLPDYGYLLASAPDRDAAAA